MGKRVAALEVRVTTLENVEDEDRRLLRRLRKLLAAWISD
jgi:hypothetical protein